MQEVFYIFEGAGPFFSEEKKAKDFLKGQGKEKAYSKTLLPQKPPYFSEEKQAKDSLF